MTEEIKFTIDKKTGDVKVETSGFCGGACTDKLKRLQDAMKSAGIEFKIEHQEIKPEMHQSGQVCQNAETHH
jgi:hypothetical protein